MKTNKKAIGTQRRLMDTKAEPWRKLRLEKPPPSGWLKAIRGALGISARQLATMLGVDASAIIRLEEREPQGKFTFELLDRAAKAMGCKVVYAIVPDAPHNSLEDIVDFRARKAASELIQKVEHSMRLEGQGSPESTTELDKLTQEFKTKMDPRVWGATKPIKKKRLD